MPTYFLKTDADYGDEVKIGKIVEFPMDEFSKNGIEIPKWDSFIYIMFEHHGRSAFVDYIGMDSERGVLKFEIRDTGGILDYNLENTVQTFKSSESEMVGRYALYYDLMFSGAAIKKKPEGMA